jgi:histidyl-tRNA synthetase
MKFKKVRGVKDILPEEVEKINFVVNTCRQIVESYGFKEVILPVLERMELYQHSIGETTDIVEKQMFKIVSRNPAEEQTETIVLRPEGTAGLVRMFVENNFKDKYSLKRFYYFGPMFRYERPQKGRYREFYQFGIEIFGEPAPSSDFLLIKIVNSVFEKLKIKVDLEINSIGCKNCRKNYVVELKEELEKIKDSLCDVCKNRVERNPLRVFDCKTDVDKVKKLAEKVNIQNYLCESCKKSFISLVKLLDENKISYKIVPTLVRGLDYYNGTVFEYKTQLLDAAQNTICAGGRYDEFISQVEPQVNHACGLAFGIDRIVEVLKDYKEKNNKIKVGIAIVDNKFLSTGFNVLDKLLENKKNVQIVGPFTEKSLKSQLRLFNNENCKYVVIIGEETEQNKVVLKNFYNNSQQIVELQDLDKFIV